MNCHIKRILTIAIIAMCLCMCGCRNRDEYGENVVVIGVVQGGEALQNAVAAYNQSHTDMQVEIKDYAQERHPVDALVTDWMTKSIPDVICLDWLPVEQYVEKGILENLAPYYEKDTELNTGDLVSSAYKQMQTESGMYFVSPGFSIRTMAGGTLASKLTKNYTLKDIQNLLNREDGDVQVFYGQNKGSMLYVLLEYTVEDYVNRESGTCDFDGDRFKEVLEFCNDYGKDETDAYDQEELDLAQEGKLLLSETSVTLTNLQIQREMYREDVCYPGYPCSSGNGLYMEFQTMLGINAKSEKKDAAWSFIRTFMEYDYQRTDTYCELPTRQDCLEQMVAERMSTTPYTDAYGETITPGEESVMVGNREIAISPATREDVELFYDLLNRTDQREQRNATLMEDIIQTEAAKYFAGKKTIAETMSVIQKRSETYVNEQR